MAEEQPPVGIRQPELDIMWEVAGSLGLSSEQQALLDPKVAAVAAPAVATQAEALPGTKNTGQTKRPEVVARLEAAYKENPYPLKVKQTKEMLIEKTGLTSGQLQVGWLYEAYWPHHRVPAAVQCPRLPMHDYLPAAWDQQQPPSYTRCVCAAVICYTILMCLLRRHFQNRKRSMGYTCMYACNMHICARMVHIYTGGDHTKHTRTHTWAQDWFYRRRLKDLSKCMSQANESNNGMPTGRGLDNVFGEKRRLCEDLGPGVLASRVAPADPPCPFRPALLCYVPI